MKEDKKTATETTQPTSTSSNKLYFDYSESQKQHGQVQEKTQIDPLGEEIPDFVSDDAILEFEDDEKSDSRISS